MRLRPLAVALVLPLLLGLGVAVGTASPAAAGTSKEHRLLQRINTSRANHGLPPLKLRDQLSAYAESHARTMSAQRSLFHTTDFGTVCCWASIAENVGVGYTVRGVHRNFMDSPAHRANILDPDMRAIGLGIVKSGGRLWVTEIFRDPR